MSKLWTIAVSEKGWYLVRGNVMSKLWTTEVSEERWPLVVGKCDE